jgi:hypothetical protein
MINEGAGHRHKIEIWQRRRYERVIREAIVLLLAIVPAGRAHPMYQNIRTWVFPAASCVPDTRPANGRRRRHLPRDREAHGNTTWRVGGAGNGVGGLLGSTIPPFGQKKGHFQWQFGKNISDFAVTHRSGDPSPASPAR